MENTSIAAGAQFTPTSLGDEPAKLDDDGAHVLDVLLVFPRLGGGIGRRGRTRGGTGSGSTVTLGSGHTARRCARGLGRRGWS